MFGLFSWISHVPVTRISSPKLEMVPPCQLLLGIIIHSTLLVRNTFTCCDTFMRVLLWRYIYFATVTSHSSDVVVRYTNTGHTKKDNVQRFNNHG